VIQGQVSPKTQMLANMQDESQSRLASLRGVLGVLWLVGAMVIGAYLLTSNFALWRIVKRERPLLNQMTLELFEECKSRMGVQTVVALVPSAQIKSPALFGFIRPRLLLPREMLEKASQEEMRYVFLHELAHLKRRDIYLGWLTSLLQVLHWFNPLVWFAFFRMRSDRELACDALVLARTQKEESQEYGRAIVSLLRRFSRSRPLPAMAGILETKAQLKRRITMIARFKKNSYQWSPLAVILMIILACVSLPDAKRTRASDSSTAQSAPPIMLRRVWSSSYPITNGQPSPDGRYLSYTDWETGDLAIYEIATGTKRRLTNKGTRDESDDCAYSSVWSPDGRQIVYCWETWEQEDRSMDLRVIGLDGSKPRILYGGNETEWARVYDWSPDNKQILTCLLRKDGKGKISLVSVSDGSVNVLKAAGKLLDWPENMSFSPDGRFIVYSYRQEENSRAHDISLMPVDGSREIPLVEHPAHDFVLGWAADGKNILFASDRTGTIGIWLVAVADGKPQGAAELVKPNAGQFQPLGLTKDGSYYYGPSRGSDDVYVATLDPQTGKIIAPLKKAVQRYEGSNIVAVYSPDGKYLAYIYRSRILSRRHSDNILCIRSLETGQEREFPLSLDAVSRYASLHWSPDGRSILVSGSNGSDRAGIYMIDVQTGAVKYLVKSHACVWSPDGKSIFYPRANRDATIVHILVRDLETGEEKTLLPSASDKFVFNMALSPDGQSLALRCIKPTSLKIVPVAGGEARELPEFERAATIQPIAWTADSKYILFSGNEPGGEKHPLYRISVESGKAENLGLKMHRYHALSTHPDGRQILISGSESGSESEVWVMENFLPEAPVAKPEPTTTLRQVRMESGGLLSLSPDGKYLCDVDWDTGNLVLRELATGNVRPLTDKGNWEHFAGFATISTISRDSKKVAFLWYNHERQCFDLREIGLDGSGDRVVRRFLEKDKEMEWLEPAAWSPDAKQILVRFSIEEERNQIAWVSITDGSMRTVKVLNESWPGKIDVSPDGRYIVYDLPQEEETSRRDIFAFDIEENREVPLVQHPADDKLMGWTPDGRHIFFTSNRMGSWDGWILPVARGEPSGLPELVKASTGDVSPIGFTPSGSFYYTPAYGPCGVYTAALDLQTGKVLSSPRPVRHTGTEELPDWSPDGKYLAYCTRPRGEKSQIIHIRSVETGQERQLDAKLPYFHWLRWSPDGRSILVGGLEEKNLRNVVYKVDVLTGERTVVLHTETGMIPGAALSSDGKALVYSHWDGAAGSARFMVRDLETGLEKQLVRAAICPHPYLGWALSPDGKELAFILEFPAVRTLNTISTTGGERKELLRMKEEQASDVAWTGDSQNVLFMRGKALWRIPAEGGEPRKLWTWEKRHLCFEGIRVHPDGRKLAFAVTEPRNEVWVMENFLPQDVGK